MPARAIALVFYTSLQDTQGRLPTPSPHSSTLPACNCSFHPDGCRGSLALC